MKFGFYLEKRGDIYFENSFVSLLVAKLLFLILRLILGIGGFALAVKKCHLVKW